MASGIAYDSDEGRALGGALSALMTGICYQTSAEMAAELGAFPGHEDNAQAMLRVMRNHRRAAYGEVVGLRGTWPSPRCALDRSACLDPNVVDHARAAWDRAHRARRAARLPQCPGQR